MKFKIQAVSIIFAFFSFTGWAQNSTNSPYSGFGIGELEMSSGGRNTGMGHTGIALKSNLFLNTTNPASLTVIDPQSFILDMGVHFSYTNLENSSKSVDVNNGNLSWLQMGFPISKRIFGGISLNPKSSVGYNIYTKRTIQGTTSEFPAIYEGTGGLSEAAGLLAFKLNDFISFGAKAGYIWGNVTQTEEQKTTISSTTYTIDQEDKTHYSGVYFDLGSQVTIPVSSKSTLIWGVVAGINSHLNSTRSTTITKTYGTTTDVITSDSKSYNCMNLPIDLGTGISLLYGPKWVGTFDFRRSDWKDASLNISSRKLSTNNIFSGGIEFSPKNKSNLLKQATHYRLGYRYETGYLKVYNQQIHGQGITFGVGLPIRKEMSFANFTVELGTRGTKEANLVKEKYIKLTASFNLWDKWFIKRQYE